MKRSTSDLFIANCDEFIFYDDLVRKKPSRKRPATSKKTANKRSNSGKSDSDPDTAKKQDQAVDLVVETIETLIEERGADALVWASMVKQTIKRRDPGFNEGYHGFSGFNTILEEARDRGLIELESDERSGSYTIRGVKN